MGSPLLLVEAASRYRGDLEDRRTELLAVALDEHAEFRDQLLRRLGVTDSYERAEVTTQRTYRVGSDRIRVRIDLVIRLMGSNGHQEALVFIENKFNPEASPSARWFDDDQAQNQHAALQQEAGDASHRLAAIVSNCDLGHPRRWIPHEYGDALGWREVAELAGLAGGPIGWQVLAREPTAPASQRVLLEVWAYLKGDAVGALEDDDLAALGRTALAWERVVALLSRVSEVLGWEDEVYDEWETQAETGIVYIAGEAPAESWVATCEEGRLYVAITDGLWDDEAPVGEPQIYAGWGVVADRDARTVLASSSWPALVEGAGLVPIFDREGVYAFGRRDLKEFVRPGSTLSEQVSGSVEWIQAMLPTTLQAPEPRA